MEYKTLAAVAFACALSPLVAAEECSSVAECANQAVSIANEMQVANQSLQQRIQDLEARLGQLNSEITRVDEKQIFRGDVVSKSYGDGRHKDTTKSVNCPEGHYVYGISVQYGGTCRGQCEADGGVIRNVTLQCAVIRNE